MLNKGMHVPTNRQCVCVCVCVCVCLSGVREPKLNLLEGNNIGQYFKRNSK